MNRLMTCLIRSFMFSSEAYSTNQTPDIVLHNGIGYYLHGAQTRNNTWPLESLYKGDKEKPLFSTRNAIMVTSGNFRGYVAIWEIKDNSLFLKGINASLLNPNKSHTQRQSDGSMVFPNPYSRRADQHKRFTRADLNMLFPQRCRNNEVKADWYTGTLTLATYSFPNTIFTRPSDKETAEIKVHFENGLISDKELPPESTDKQFDKSSNRQ